MSGFPNFGFQVGTPIVSQNIPQIYSVASGSYALNKYYGSGIPPVLNGDSVTMSESQHRIRCDTKEVTFMTTLVLDLSLPNPFTTSSAELRIRTKPSNNVSYTYPTASAIALPAPPVGAHQPLFGDVEIIFEDNTTAVTGLTNTGELKARLNFDGSLSLVLVNYVSDDIGAQIPITVANLPAFEDDESPHTQCIFVLKGTYLSN